MQPTIPPSGLAPTIPPPPKSRARRAVLLAAVGIALLAIALLWRAKAQADVSSVFAYDNDAELGTFVRRVMFGFSGALTIAATAYATGSFKHARGPATVALVLAVAWLGSVVWTILF